MTPSYLHLLPGTILAKWETRPFRAVIVAELETSQEWRNQVAEWLVNSGCLYVIAWGIECEAWHNTVDWTNLEKFEFGEIPDDHFIMTTWHEGEPMNEVFWFAGQCAFHPTVDLKETLLVDVAPAPRKVQLLESFAASQPSPEGQ